MVIVCEFTECGVMLCVVMSAHLLILTICRSEFSVMPNDRFFKPVGMGVFVVSMHENECNSSRIVKRM